MPSLPAHDPREFVVMAWLSILPLIWPTNYMVQSPWEDSSSSIIHLYWARACNRGLTSRRFLRFSTRVSLQSALHL